MAPRHAAPSDRLGRVRAFTTLGAVGTLAVIALLAGVLPTNLVVAQPAGAATHGALRVAAITPSGASVAPDAVLEVRFNNPLARNSPLPTIAPAVAGSWMRLSPSALVFETTSGFVPGSAYAVVVPAGAMATDGTTLKVRVVHRFMVAQGSALRLNQLLAELDYLPLRFVHTGPYDAGSSAVQRGVFAWRFADVPEQLTSLWQPSAYNTLTKGALMRFQNVEDLPTTGVADGQTWHALLAAVDQHKADPDTYNYVLVTTSLPETLTLYVNFKPIYHTLVNTGISVRPTALATNPVYLRYTVTTMSGTNPDGTHYDDPGIPWVSYFNGGEALHGYIRASYGWPQSLGCVEMPFANAEIVWPYTPIGTLVTVY